MQMCSFQNESSHGPPILMLELANVLKMESHDKQWSTLKFRNQITHQGKKKKTAAVHVFSFHS